MDCCVCAGSANTLSLPCLHVVHAACARDICPKCGNTATSLKSALLANQLYAEDELAYVDGLPVCSRRFDTWIVNIFASGAKSAQRDDDGAWIFLLYGDAVQIWLVRPLVSAYWYGRFVDGLLESLKCKTTGDRMDPVTMKRAEETLADVMRAFNHT